MSSTQGTMTVTGKWMARRKADEAEKEAAAQEERAMSHQEVEKQTAGVLSGGKRAGAKVHNPPRPVSTQSPLPSHQSDVSGPDSPSHDDNSSTGRSLTLTISRLEEDLRSEKEQHAQCEEKLKDAEARRDDLERALKDARRELKVATGAGDEAEFRTREQIRDRLMGQLDQAQDECAALRKALGQSRVRIDELEKENWDMRRENRNMQRERNAAPKDIDPKENVENEALQPKPSSLPLSKTKRQGGYTVGGKLIQFAEYAACRNQGQGRGAR
ncbi:uncharacterized protein PV07_03826 [Cladophialophora immunda]|uniref:Uncharacterized protein n=1 Tax=Cladophialophora immunda TaxID=569365 RepID=A0A0D1ZVP6_9EURO|nr:uncharacterized protein PV07_03826 [Cladophialophora immunda]KIW32266.1 hypothetical protein PV07_03826 [Cladophialophora immunda]